MKTNTVNGLLFIIAGLTPFIVYLGLGPDGAAILDQARAEQLFAYLFFALPIAIMMSRRIEKNYFIDGGLIIILASMSLAMAADAFRAAANLNDVANAIAVTAYSSTILGVSISGIGFFRTTIFPKWLSGLLTVVTAIGFILLATSEPSALQTSVIILPFLLAFHVILIVLGVFMFRRND